MFKQITETMMQAAANLSRFLEAQENTYSSALREIKAGKKTSHWMWFIFPQIIGLGSTDYSIKYSIQSKREANAYLKHPVLGTRLIEISSALLSLNDVSAFEIFGKPDDRKLKSCMTLFSQVSGDEEVFNNVLAKYYNGELDQRTIQILSELR
ncbi:MAG: DUF1810 domain-containing protein [Daejeonella sp.]